MPSLLDKEREVRRLTLSRRHFLKRTFQAGLALAAIDGFFIEPEWLKLHRIEVPIRDLPPSFDGYRIGLLSDIHYPFCIAPAFIRRAVAMMMAFEPDLVALPGDFMDEKALHHTARSMAGLLDATSSAPDGVVGTLGNHDHRVDADGVRRQLALTTPVELVENRSLLIERRDGALAIGGVGDLYHGIVDPRKAFDGVDPNVPRIMLSHNPDVAEDMDPAIRVDLQLSGHTHGGQVRIPFGPAPWIPSKYGQKFRAGLVQGKANLVYVTKGICSLRDFRFDCRPEVTGVILRRMA